MSKIVNTSVIFGNLKVYYNYFKLQPCQTLNPMGNFYRNSHFHKETQRFMENYLKSGDIPKIGDEIISDKLFSNLIITNIIFNYVRTEGELWIKELEDSLEEFKNMQKNKKITVDEFLLLKKKKKKKNKKNLY